MDDLQRRLLQAAYKLGINRPAHQVGLNEIADELGLEHSVFPYRGPLDNAAQYLGTRGFIKKQTNYYEILSLTSRGIEEAERAADPVTERKKRHERLLRAIYRLSGGSPAQPVHWRDLASEMGLDSNDREHQKQTRTVAEYLEGSGLVALLRAKGEPGTRSPLKEWTGWRATNRRSSPPTSPPPTTSRAMSTVR